MFNPFELPECLYLSKPALIRPATPTPSHSLYLSNLDDQKFLRFSIKYLYLFRTAVAAERLKTSLARALVEYYPLAGRLRKSGDDDGKLEVDCNGEGAVFAEAEMDLSADEFLQVAGKPDKSFRKLLYRVDSSSFLDVPPLLVQVTHLRCGGMILCTAITHCLCDGIGTSQFLQAWAHLTNDHSDSNYLPIQPFHGRHLFKPRSPPQVTSSHPGFTRISPTTLGLTRYLQSQPLVASSTTFRSSHILHLKRQCVPSIKCTSFEVLASHTWRCWVKALGLLNNLTMVKLLFSLNIRKKLDVPQGYYGNGFVMACAEAKGRELIEPNLHEVVKLVQHAKASTNDQSVKSLVDLLEDKMVITDLSASFVISQWSRLGLEDLDFGRGKPLHMGPVTSDVYCLFLPVIGDNDAITVLVALPELMVERFEFHMKQVLDSSENREDAKSTNLCGINNLPFS